MSLGGFVHFYILESSDCVSEELLPISTLSYSRTGSCSPSAFYALSYSLSKCWHAFYHARGWQTNDLSHAAFTQARPLMARKNWRPNDVTIAQTVSRASKRNKTSQNHTSLLQELDCSRFEPKRRFWSAFQFPGTRNKWMYYRCVKERGLMRISPTVLQSSLSFLSCFFFPVFFVVSSIL